MKTLFMKFALSLILLIPGFKNSYAQSAADWKNRFQKDYDTVKFLSRIVSNGISYSYIKAAPVLWYSDTGLHFKKFTDSFLVKVEGEMVNTQRQGVFTYSLIDRTNRTKTYRLYEQSFKNDKLDGAWRSYSLDGKLVMLETYFNGELRGLQRTYKTDGTINEETEILQGDKYIIREYYPSGKLMTETNFFRDRPHGQGKKYYESGILEDSLTFNRGEIDGRRYYYHSNGQLWVEQQYFAGLPWEIIANYDSKGKKRDGGNLKDGSGTMIFYNDDDTVREIKKYKNGKEIE